MVLGTTKMGGAGGRGTRGGSSNGTGMGGVGQQAPVGGSSKAVEQPGSQAGSVEQPGARKLTAEERAKLLADVESVGYVFLVIMSCRDLLFEDAECFVSLASRHTSHIRISWSHST